MPPRAGHATTRSARYALGPGADLPIARIVAVLLILLPLGALWIISNVARSGPSSDAAQIGSFDPRSLLADSTPHFLPTPVAALPADSNAGPPAPASQEQTAPTVERVKVANTGGAGAILRASPPRGAVVKLLYDGASLEVIEHQSLPDGSEWLHVRTAEGIQGWIFSRLTSPSD